MFPSFTSVLLVTALTSVWAQDHYEERKTPKKSRGKPLAANIHDGQGKKINEKQYIQSFWSSLYCCDTSLSLLGGLFVYVFPHLYQRNHN